MRITKAQIDKLQHDFFTTLNLHLQKNMYKYFFHLYHVVLWEGIFVLRYFHLLFSTLDFPVYNFPTFSKPFQTWSFSLESFQNTFPFIFCFSRLKLLPPFLPPSICPSRRWSSRLIKIVPHSSHVQHNNNNNNNNNNNSLTR